MNRVHATGMRKDCWCLTDVDLDQGLRRILIDNLKMSMLKAMLKDCPRCRIAMLGSKSNPASSHPDRYECLQCGTIISYPPSTADKSDQD